MKLYRPKNLWLNDPKVFYEKGKYHLFHLQGRKAETWQEISKQREAYGHAVSDDGINWETVNPIVKPGKKGSWDDKGTWTGDIIKKDGIYYLLYTGICYKDTIQRLGLATSKDLINWTKYRNNPVSEPDPRYYLCNVTKGYGHVAWRDPGFLCIDESGWVYAYLCSQLKNKVWDKMGCVGLIRSKDMINWEAMPPVYSPGTEVYHEVPQVIKVKDKYVLLFGSKEETDGPGLSSCVKYVISDDPFSWDINAKTTRLIGGKPRTEYTTCVYKRNNKFELIHLTYEGTDKDPRGFIRGRVSLPKSLCFKDNFTPCVTIRPDLKPQLSKKQGFSIENDNQVMLGKISNNSISLKVKTTGSAELSILAGLNKSFTRGKSIIPVNRKGHLRITDIENSQVCDYGRVSETDKNEYLVTMILLNEHIEIYVNDIYIGTCFSLKTHLYLALKVSGKGTVLIESTGVEGVDENTKKEVLL